MKVCNYIDCSDFCCGDIDNEAYLAPYREINPNAIKIIMVSEAPPPDRNDYFYAPYNPFYLQTTVQAFNDAGINAAGMQDILGLGVYITTAVKCGKTGYSISTETINRCSELLEQEIALFPGIEVFMLMGDTAIKAMNHIWKKQSGAAVIPGGSTYKIRKEKFYYQGKRVFPSYLQTGKNYLIEKSKRRMIAEDIGEAVELIG
ncbi:uracil-DNA glycosylase family protein [Chloroflexota bacterium]